MQAVSKFLYHSVYEANGWAQYLWIQLIITDLIPNNMQSAATDWMI